MTTIILGLKAVSFLLLLLPFVDLVDRHKNGEWLVGERSKAREILYMGQTVNSQSMSTGVGVHGAAPGNWNALPATLSDRPTASTGYLRPSASANESSTSTLGDRRYGSSFGSFYTFGGDSSFTTNHQHGHGLVATSSSTTVKPQTWPLLSRRGDKISLSSEKQVQGMHKFQSRTRSEQLISIMVQPPISIAYSTRVTGPYFESESNRTIIHITARAGRTVMMDCAVILLQGRTVSWLRRKEDSLQLLTVGNTTYNGDSRLGLRFRYPNNWRLGIESVNKGDEGEYQCQLSTHPPKALIYHLKVIAPAVIILDENGHSVIERHYKVDSSLHLTCRASHVEKLVENVIWLKGDSILPAGDSRIKVKFTKNQTSGEATAYLSVLSVRKGDSGNYTCRASLATSDIAVHVLNGELPAAVQHESSANKLAVASSQLATTITVLTSAAASSSLINVAMFPTNFRNYHPCRVGSLIQSLAFLTLGRLLIVYVSGAKHELMAYL